MNMSKMIYIQGIDGPSRCWYPAEGIEVVPGLYTIVKIEETLRLEFSVGDTVEVKKHMFEGGGVGLAAIRKVKTD